MSIIKYFVGRHTLILLSENKYFRFQRKKRVNERREGYQEATSDGAQRRETKDMETWPGEPQPVRMTRGIQTRHKISLSSVQTLLNGCRFLFSLRDQTLHPAHVTPGPMCLMTSGQAPASPICHHVDTSNPA